MDATMTDYEPTNLRRWTMPDSYFGATWPDYYRSGFGRSRDSSCLEESNFAVALRELGGESDTVVVVREGHWAVGWVEWIAIHQDDGRALEIADRLAEDVEDYPALDDNDWTEREMEEANTIWRDCYSVTERVAYIRRNRDQFDFHGFADLMGCVRGKYFAGYASDLLS
jgi:hypothetical protein